MNQFYIGLISGTSIDGIDAVIVDFADTTPHLIAQICYPVPEQIQQQLQQLSDQNIIEQELNGMATLDRQLGELFAQATDAVCQQAQLNPHQITAIGHHGQTIRHYPQGKYGFSIQIGDPNTLAVATGIKVVADFRRKDIALGGQGAPLVPAFHQSIFQHQAIERYIVNIGGMANLTYLPANNANPSRQIIGFDTGPGNTLLDKWIALHLQQPYDHNGDWARSGSCHPQLLAALLTHDYFALPPPKSTGREQFHLNWLDQHLSHFQQIDAADVQATLTQLTVISIAEQIKTIDNRTQPLTPITEIYLCGGGARNKFLCQQLTAQFKSVKVSTTTDLGVDPDWVEGMAFAWLAKAYMDGLPGNITSVTGADRSGVLGCLYYPF